MILYVLFLATVTERHINDNWTVQNMIQDQANKVAYMIGQGNIHCTQE